MYSEAGHYVTLGGEFGPDLPSSQPESYPDPKALSLPSWLAASLQQLQPLFRIYFSKQKFWGLALQEMLKVRLLTCLARIHV